jgi:hypothetical protein
MTDSKANLLQILEEQKNDYISREGYREYSCLLDLVECGSIKTFEELAEYGIETEGYKIKA